jgi:hypothetical protein
VALKGGGGGEEVYAVFGGETRGKRPLARQAYVG